MKKRNYKTPETEQIPVMLEENFLGSNRGNGTGSNMNAPDYSQNPF